MSKKQFFFITFPLDQLLQPMKFVVGMENVDEMTITNWCIWHYFERTTAKKL